MYPAFKYGQTPNMEEFLLARLGDSMEKVDKLRRIGILLLIIKNHELYDRQDQLLKPKEGTDTIQVQDKMSKLSTQIQHIKNRIDQIDRVTEDVESRTYASTPRWK